MSDTETVPTSRRVSRRGIAGAQTIKPSSKKQANEDAAMLAAADEELDRRRRLAAQQARADKGERASRAAPRTERREFLDEDGKPFTRRSGRDGNAFDVPKHLMKADWDYQWMPIRVNGEPVDSSTLVDYREGGWRSVPAKDMKLLVPPGWDKPHIERGGQILFMRPMYLTIEAQNESIKIAEDQKYDKLKGALAGPGELGKVTKRHVTENKMTRGLSDLHSDID